MSGKRNKLVKKSGKLSGSHGSGHKLFLKDQIGGNKWLILFCVAVTFFVYISSALHNGFIEIWDDIASVTDNPLIKSWSFSALFTTRTFGRFHPLEMLLLTIEYHLFGMSPAGYHLVSLLLHLINVALTFLFIFKITGKQWAAFIVSLLFAIHPMHVETVAWVSDQLDLLYTLFYLAAILSYLSYIRKSNTVKWYRNRYWYVTCFFFLLSLLSKEMAVVLPVTFALIDCYRSDNWWNIKFIISSIFHKTFFFLLSLALGVLAYTVQKHTVAMKGADFSAEQIMLVCYGVTIYIVKFFLPLSLSSFYPYPIKDSTGIYSLIVRISPVIVIGVILFFIGLIIIRLRKRKSGNVLIFGFLFFIINVVLVLQFFRLGDAIFAERYTYLSYTGLFLIIAMSINFLLEKFSRGIKLVIIIALSTYLIYFISATVTYSKAWQNGTTLSINVIENFPSSSFGYSSLANVYLQQEDFYTADSLLTRAVELKSTVPSTYSNRAFCYMKEGKYNLTIADCNTVIAMQPDYILAYKYRAYAYTNTGKFDLAIADYNKIIKAQPDSAEAYINRASAYINTGKFDLAIADCNKVITLQPDSAQAYLYRANAYVKQQKPDLAIADCNKAISLQPGYAYAYLNRANGYINLKKFDLAIADCNEAIILKPNYAEAYDNRAYAYEMMGNYTSALQDAIMAQNYGIHKDESYMNDLKLKAEMQSKTGTNSR
jgi:protein O-mannosyl-transferase